MAQTRIDSGIAPSFFEEFDRAEARIIALEKHIQGVDMKIGGSKSLSELNTQLIDLSTNTIAVKEAVKAQTAARRESNITAKEDLAYQKELEVQGKGNIKTLLAIEKAKKQDAKIAYEASSAYKILSKAYQDASLRAKDYALTLGLQHPITMQAQADALAMGNRLKELDRGVGQFQRNVGNYNMVGAQFNQLLREGPNFAISFRTGIMALSNNITYFAETVKQAKTQGDSWGKIMKSVGGSLFGFVGIMNIAITAFTFFTLAIEKSGRAAKEAKDEYKAYLDAMEASSETALSDIETQINRERLLIGVLKSSTASQEQKRIAIEELRDSYYSLLKNMSDEQVLTAKSIQLIEEEIVYKENYADATRKMILTEGQLRKEKEKIAPLLEEESKQRKEREAAEARIALIQRSSVISSDEKMRMIASEQKMIDSYKGTSTELKAVTENVSKYERELKALQAQQLEFALKSGLFKPTSETGGKDKEIEEQIKFIEYKAKLDNDYNDALSNALEIEVQNRNNALFEIRASETDHMQWLEKSLAEGGISYEEYEKQKADITLKYAIKRQEAELVYYKAVAKYTTDPAKLKDLLQLIEEAKLKIAALNNELNNIPEKPTEKLKDKLKEIADILRTVNAAFSEIMGIQSDRLAARISQLQSEGQLIEDNGRREIAKIQNSARTEEEKQKAIREQEAATESQRLANDARQRQAARDKAAFDKAANISNIITSGALLVIKQYVENGVAGAAIAGVAVAAQLARAIAAPLPAYEEGTLNHKGGKFIAGEKEKELVIRPDGKKYWTDDKPSLYDEPAGTQVFNRDMINTLAGAGLTPNLIKIVGSDKGTGTERIAAVVAEAVKDGTKSTVRAINKNRAIQNVSIDAPDYYYMAKVKGRA